MDLTLSNITFNQILIFLAVAETQGFLKASSQLGLTQSAVSKSIAKLEKDLDLKLFRRTTRQLELTKEGEQLFEAWKPMVASIQTAYKHVLKARDQESRAIHIGLVSTVIPNKYFSPVREAFQEAYPDVQIRLYIESMPKLEEMLNDGQLDVAFIPDFEHYFMDENNINWMWFQKKHARVILSSSHPLAGKKTVMMKDLLNEKFAALQDQQRGNYIRDLKDRFAVYGMEPNIVLPYQSAYEIRNLFKPKDEILFVDQFFDNLSYDDTTHVLVDDEWTGIICAYKDSGSRTVKDFLDVVRANVVIDE